MLIGYGLSINYEYLLSVLKDIIGDVFSIKDLFFVYGFRKYLYFLKKVIEFELVVEVGGLIWGV